MTEKIKSILLLCVILLSCTFTGIIGSAEGAERWGDGWGDCSKEDSATYLQKEEGPNRENADCCGFDSCKDEWKDTGSTEQIEYYDHYSSSYDKEECTYIHSVDENEDYSKYSCKEMIFEDECPEEEPEDVCEEEEESGEECEPVPDECEEEDKDEECPDDEDEETYPDDDERDKCPEEELPEEEEESGEECEPVPDECEEEDKDEEYPEDEDEETYPDDDKKDDLPDEDEGEDDEFEESEEPDEPTPGTPYRSRGRGTGNATIIPSFEELEPFIKSPSFDIEQNEFLLSAGVEGLEEEQLVHFRFHWNMTMETGDNFQFEGREVLVRADDGIYEITLTMSRGERSKEVSQITVVGIPEVPVEPELPEEIEEITPDIPGSESEPHPAEGRVMDWLRERCSLLIIYEEFGLIGVAWIPCEIQLALSEKQPVECFYEENVFQDDMSEDSVLPAVKGGDRL